MSEVKMKSDGEGQRAKDKVKVKISMLAVAAVVCGVINLISFGIISAFQQDDYSLPEPVIKLLVLMFIASILLAFVLGCICLGAMIFCKKGFKRYSLGLVGLAVAVLIGIYIGIMTRNAIFQIHCGRNMKAMCFSMILYTKEHNGNFPPTDRWCDVFIEEADGTPKMFICPKSDAAWGESSYAMNIGLAGKKRDEVRGDTVMFFETDSGKESGPRNHTIESREFSKILTLSNERKNQRVYKNRWNQSGGPESATVSNHAEKMCMAAFVDGTVDFVKLEDIKNLRWEAEEPNE